MNVFKCLNQTNVSLLECISFNDLTSKCRCILKNSDDTIEFKLLKTDVYTNLNINEVKNLNLTDKWYTPNAERIDDCFRFDKRMQWICKTWAPYLNNTLCNCFSETDFNYIASGDIFTKSLYKGLENFTFPLITDHDLVGNNTVGRKHFVKSVENSTFTNANEIFSKKESSLTDNNNFNMGYTPITYASTYTFLFVFCLILIILIFKNIKRCKNSGVNDDIISFISFEELNEIS